MQPRDCGPSMLTADRIGAQVPRVWSAPDYVSSRGVEAVEFACAAGLILDDWQEFVLEHSCGIRDDGMWAAFEVGVDVTRQNGKGGILEARELIGAFEWGEKLVIHSAHEFPTSLEHFNRLLWLIEDTPDLDQQVKRVSRAHGEEGIELRNGNRIRFRTRTKGGGRGFSGDFIAFDEAMVLAEAFIGALLPTVSARSITGNPQVWYTGSAVDQTVHEHGHVFARVRDRGHMGDESLAFFEWSSEVLSEDGEPVPLAQVTREMLDDEQLWSDANPGLGIRISAEHVAKELRSMDARTFAVERLGIGDWPATGSDADAVISADAWAALADETSVVVDPVCFAFDVKLDRSFASIGLAGERADGRPHLEIVARREGTGWIVGLLAELRDKHEDATFVCDSRGPGASLLPELAELGVEVETADAHANAVACGLIFDLVEQKRLRHPGTPELAASVRGARKRPLGDAWAWSRKNSTVDISPLVAVTLALWGSSTLSSAEPWGEAW